MGHEQEKYPLFYTVSFVSFSVPDPYVPPYFKNSNKTHVLHKQRKHIEIIADKESFLKATIMVSPKLPSVDTLSFKPS